MKTILTFGKYKGKTMEWIFFNAPSYAEWIYSKGIHLQEHNFTEEEAAIFKELFERASSLTGICTQCKAKPITYMGLGTLRGTGQMAQVGFYCDDCEYIGGTPTEYYEPSFFAPYILPQSGQQKIVKEIRRHYLGSDGNLTQKRMEEFFRDDNNFVNPEIGFFQEKMQT